MTDPDALARYDEESPDPAALEPSPRSAAYTVDVRRLPPGAVFLHLVVRSTDAGTFCDGWWRGFVSNPLPPDAGPAVPDAGEDGGVEPPPPPRGCGCGAGAAPLLFAALACFSRFKRRA